MNKEIVKIWSARVRIFVSKIAKIFTLHSRSRTIQYRATISEYGNLCIGSNKKPPLRSPKCSSKSQFPLGELSRQKANLRDEYLSKSKELCALKKKIKRLQEKSEKVQECMNELEITPIQPRSSAFVVSTNTSTRCKKDPSELSDDGKLK